MMAFGSSLLKKGLLLAGFSALFSCPAVNCQNELALGVKSTLEVTNVSFEELAGKMWPPEGGMFVEFFITAAEQSVPGFDRTRIEVLSYDDDVASSKSVMEFWVREASEITTTSTTEAPEEPSSSSTTSTTEAPITTTEATTTTTTSETTTTTPETTTSTTLETTSSTPEVTTSSEAEVTEESEPEGNGRRLQALDGATISAEDFVNELRSQSANNDSVFKTQFIDVVVDAFVEQSPVITITEPEEYNPTSTTTEAPTTTTTTTSGAAGLFAQTPLMLVGLVTALGIGYAVVA
eukprot:GHVT01041879.1.p4 GENE.GHVT01041879.1~~GHVT01041879.1.p4  ORF type:complete len:293 (+),score=54.02 GHVT01041879.1:898-1776(+)